ncbi:hypothetical protein Y710_03965 [Gordonia sp. QH-12]|nr:hypothetical protein Y710_03965 [Gordonia sp. QH-12]
MIRFDPIRLNRIGSNRIDCANSAPARWLAAEPMPVSARTLAGIPPVGRRVASSATMLDLYLQAFPISRGWWLRSRLRRRSLTGTR